MLICGADECPFVCKFSCRQAVIQPWPHGHGVILSYLSCRYGIGGPIRSFNKLMLRNNAEFPMDVIGQGHLSNAVLSLTKT